MAINFRPDNNYQVGGPVDKSLPQPPALPNSAGPMPYTSQGELPPLGGGFRPVQPPSPITPDQPAGEPVDISTQQFPTQFLGDVLAGTETTPAFEFPENTLGQEQEDIVQGLAGIDFTGREQPVFNPTTNKYTWEGNSFTPNELRENFGFPAVSDSSEPVDTAYGSFATQDAFDFFQKYLGQQFPLGVEQQPEKRLTIEERNAPVIDIMHGQGTQPVFPPGGEYQTQNIVEQAEEFVQPQNIESLDNIVSAQAVDPTTISAPDNSVFPSVAAVKREEIDDAEAAKLDRDEISPEISIEEIDVLGTVSDLSQAQAQAADLDVKSTVKGQLEQLYTSIVDGQPLPPWASGPVRVASQIMQQRGLGASSIAGAALVQAVQESAIPIAAADAQMYATFQLKNLDNRQAAALQNALTYAQMDQRNQNARMTAAIQNSQNFLSIDTANLTAEQTTEQINFAANVQEMFTDQAAENATEQFNATGQIQVEEFFQELGAKVRTRNAELAVANDQFNVDQKNSINQFNNQIKNDRDKFEANLSTQIQQSNAVWRRNINTVNNSAQNEANKINSQNILGINEVAQANLWQAYRDDAQFLIQTTENALQRAHQVGILSQQQDFQAEQYREAADDAMWGQIGALAGTIITSLVTS